MDRAASSLLSARASAIAEAHAFVFLVDESATSEGGSYRDARADVRAEAADLLARCGGRSVLIIVNQRTEPVPEPGDEVARDPSKLVRALALPLTDRSGLRCFSHAATAGRAFPALPAELRRHIYCAAAAAQEAAASVHCPMRLVPSRAGGGNAAPGQPARGAHVLIRYTSLAFIAMSERH
eukprot:7094080-Prymnesium_polylepis.1